MKTDTLIRNLLTCDTRSPWTGREGIMPMAAKRLADMMVALEQCAEYFDNKSDVKDGENSNPEPNEEMRLLSEIKMAIGDAP